MGNNHWERQWQSQNGTRWCKKIPDSQVRLRHPDSFQGTIRRRKRKKKNMILNHRLLQSIQNLCKYHQLQFKWQPAKLLKFPHNTRDPHQHSTAATVSQVISHPEQMHCTRLCSIPQVVCCNHRAVQKVFSQHLRTTNVLSTLHGLPAVNLLKQSPGKS